MHLHPEHCSERTWRQSDAKRITNAESADAVTHLPLLFPHFLMPSWVDPLTWTSTSAYRGLQFLLQPHSQCLPPLPPSSPALLCSSTASALCGCPEGYSTESAPSSEDPERNSGKFLGCHLKSTLLEVGPVRALDAVFERLSGIPKGQGLGALHF